MVNCFVVNLGMMVGFVIGGFVCLYDFKYLFYIDVVICFFVMLLVWRFFGFVKI